MPDFAADLAAFVRRWPMAQVHAWIGAFAPRDKWQDWLRDNEKRNVVRKYLPEMLARLDLVQQNLFPIAGASPMELRERASRWSDAKRAREMLAWKRGTE